MPLGSHRIPVLDQVDLMALRGVELYAGYGSSLADVLARQAHARVYRSATAVTATTPPPVRWNTIAGTAAAFVAAGSLPSRVNPAASGSVPLPR